MNILFLDDSLERCKTMRSNCIGNIVICNTADEFLNVFLTEQWDRIYLDHDLNYNYQNLMLDNLKDGRYVCREIIKSNLDRNVCIIIHSLNFPASKSMEDMLKQNGFVNVTRIPFAWKYSIENKL